MNHASSEITWQIDLDGRVIVPEHIGDAEVTNISMNLVQVEITLENRGAFFSNNFLPGSKITILCFEPEHIAFQSDHLQNVVEDVYVIETTDVEKLASLPPFSIHEMTSNLGTLKSKYFVFVTPKSGVELFVACTRVQFLSNARPVPI